MARTITIRRVGSIFPALCLAVIVLVCFCFTWLSIVGLPDFVLRDIEQRAARQGICLKLGNIKLAPASGLAIKVQDIYASAPVGNDTVSLDLRKLQVSFSVFELLLGNYLPSNIHLLNLKAQIPTGKEKGKYIQLSESNTRLNLFNRGERLGVDSAVCIQGINVNFRASFQLPKEAIRSETLTVNNDLSETYSKPIQPERFLTPIQPWLIKADKLISSQQWKTGEFPHLDIKFRYHNQQPTVEIKADVPSFRQGDMKFVNSSLSARFENDVFTIEHLNFATKAPQTEVALQGAYDFAYRKLNFDIRSTAAVAQIVELLDESQKGSLLSRLCADANKAPAIKLHGQVEFSDKYALNNITLRGNIQQRNFLVNNAKIDSFELSFLLSDGKFNVDNLSLKLPEGDIKMSALSGYEQADTHIEGSLPYANFQQLAEGICGFPLNLPQEASPKGQVSVNADLLLGTKEFVPGKTRPSDLIPSLKEIQQLSICLEALQYKDITFLAPSLTIKANEIQHPDIHDQADLSAKNVQLSFHAKEIKQSTTTSITEPQFFLTMDSISADVNNPAESLLITRAELETKAKGVRYGDLTGKELTFCIRNLPDFTTSGRWEELLVRTDAKAQVQTVQLSDHPLASNLHITIEHPQLHEAVVHLSMQQQQQETNTQLRLNYRDVESTGLLLFHLQKTELPLLCHAPLLQHFNALPSAFELPESLFLQTSGSINIFNGKLGKSLLSLHIPELVRTPQSLVVNRGTQIPLSGTLNVELQSLSDDIAYTGDIKIRHESGFFQADIAGELSSRCCISKGYNTIAVNVIDALIDDEDAHGIMRDFRFGKDSSVTISDIAAEIEYDNGLTIKSFCKTDIRNTDFLIGAIEDITDSRGTIIGEKLRTDMGSDPYTRVFRANCDVLVNVQLGKKNPDGSAAPEKMQIILNSPYLDYDNRPWLRRQGIKQGVTSSIIQGDSIVFDLENRGIVLNNLKGKAYPAYAFGMYFSPLQEYMKDIQLQYPATVYTKRCEFPISRKSQVPISGLIRAESAHGASFDFLGTSIPLNRFSGFVNLSDEYVFLDKLNARTWGGVLNGAIKIGISGDSTSFDGQLTANNLDLNLIGKAYKTKLSPALCNASIRFQSPTSEVKDVKAYGSATIRDGNLMELGIFQPVGDLISNLPAQLAEFQRKVTGKAPTPAEEEKPGMISRFLSAFTDTTDKAINKVDASTRHIPFANHFMCYNIQNAELKFDILNGYLYTRDMKATGYNLEVDMNLRLNLDTLNIRGNLWPRISSVPTLLIAPITFLSDFLIDITIYGNIEDIQWKFTLDKIMKSGRKTRRPSVTAQEEQ